MVLKLHIALAVILGSWLAVAGQTNSSAALSQTPRLALEVIFQGQPEYKHIPPPRESCSMYFLKPENTDFEPTDRKHVFAQLSFQGTSTDSLGIQLLLTETASQEPDIRKVPWNLSAEYVLPLKEGATITTPELRAVGIERIQIVPAESPLPYPPRIIEDLPSLDVRTLVEDIRNSYRVELLNMSEQGIRGIFSQESGCAGTNARFETGRLVPPGETVKLDIYTSSCQQMKVQIMSVLFQDGSCEGDKVGCARIDARLEASSLAASLELPLLKEAVESGDAQHLLDALSRLEIDAKTRDKVIARLAVRYPGSIDKDWQTVIDQFSQDFRAYNGWFQQQLQFLLRESGAEDVAAGIRKQIKQCEEIVAEDRPSAPVFAVARAEQSGETRYREAYEAWMKATFKIGIQWWLSNEQGSPISRPLMDLRDFGPNITPFLVEELRQERDENRVFRLCTLLDYLSGIDLLLGTGIPLRGSFQQEYPAHREQFLAAWDSGQVTDPTERLRAARRNIDEDTLPEKVDYRGPLREVRQFGFYALPYIVETLKQHNSAELFTAFLAVTAQYDLYTRYYDSPREMFVTRPEKFAYIRAWFKANEHRIDKVQPVYGKLKQLLK